MTFSSSLDMGINSLNGGRRKRDHHIWGHPFHSNVILCVDSGYCYIGELQVDLNPSRDYLSIPLGMNALAGL